MVPAADTGPASRPAKPSGTSRAPRTATDSGRTASRRSSPPQSPGPAARRPRAQRRPPGAGWAGGKGALASPLRLQRATSTPTYSASFWHACASKTRGGSLGLRACRAHAALQTRGLRALPQRLLAVAVAAQRLQSLRAARKGLRASPAPRGPARRCPPSARSRTARACRPAGPGSSASPPRRALPASPSAASKKSRAPSRPGAGPGTPAPAPRTSAAPRGFAAALGSWPAVLRRAADGHLGALAGGAPVEHARRLPLQHPLHGPVHVAVPVEGQEAHGAVLLQRPASSARASGRWSWRSMASKLAHTSSTLSCSSLAACPQRRSAARPPHRAAGSSRSSGPSCAGAEPSPPPSWSSCSACSGC